MCKELVFQERIKAFGQKLMSYLISLIVIMVRTYVNYVNNFQNTKRGSTLLNFICIFSLTNILRYEMFQKFKCYR